MEGHSGDTAKACEHCGSVVSYSNDACLWCGQPRPSDGWEPAPDDPWLGQSMLGFRFEQRLHESEFLYRVSNDNLPCLEAQIFRLNRLAVGQRWEQRIGRVMSSVPRKSFLHVLRVWEVDDYGVLVYVPPAGMSLKNWRALEIDIDSFAALNIIEDILRALLPVHELGLHHGALEPGAVMLKPEKRDSLRIVTLGGILQSSIQNSTPAFCPDEARGDASDDIYALGAMLFWLAAHSSPPEKRLAEQAEHLLHDFNDLATLVKAFTAEDRPENAQEALPLLQHLLSGTSRMAVARDRSSTPAPVESGEFTPPTVVNPVTGEVFAFEDLFE